MSDLWICREQTARHPFCVELDGTKIYNVEELCFYLYRNIEHLDESIMGEVLYAWLNKEIGLPRLAEVLAQEQKQGKDALWCAWFLMREVGMYTDRELEHIKSICLAMSDKDEMERQKLKADRLLINKKYIRSIQEYERLIHLCEDNRQYVKLQGDIWHNKGVAHARLFLFREAAECFLQAYELNHNPESQLAYENALHLAEDREYMLEYPKGFLSQNEQIEWNNRNMEEPMNWAKVLEELREDYKKKVM